MVMAFAGHCDQGKISNRRAIGHTPRATEIPRLKTKVPFGVLNLSLKALGKSLSLPLATVHNHYLRPSCQRKQNEEEKAIGVSLSRNAKRGIFCD